MARIRSIHPGLASDESYMTMSMAAKAAWPLLWTECDDQGVFEWKPIVLKARIFPADNVDFAALLGELEGLNCIQMFTVDGRNYGAIRNFRKFQRPKSPNKLFPTTQEAELYIGKTYVPEKKTSRNNSSSPYYDEFNSDEPLSIPTKEEVTTLELTAFPQNGEIEIAKLTPIPTIGEKSPQMEDGGWRMEDGGDKRNSIKQSFPKQTVPNKACEPSLDLENAVLIFNEMAKATGLPIVQRLTEPRSKQLKSRLAECGGLDGWQNAIEKVRDSPFLRGENNQGWKADFDFVLQAKSFTKILEGSYDNRSPTQNQDSGRKGNIELVYEALSGRDSQSDPDFR